MAIAAAIVDAAEAVALIADDDDDDVAAAVAATITHNDDYFDEAANTFAVGNYFTCSCTNVNFCSFIPSSALDSFARA